MFVKKKAELPPRPKLPPTNHILQDLENTSTDDPVFAGKRLFLFCKLLSLQLNVNLIYFFIELF